MAVSYRSSTYGVLHYHPPHPLIEDPGKPAQLFRPRRRSPGRIVVKPLSGSEGEQTKVSYTAPDKPSRLKSFKLAATRENARRFLKSVIAAPLASTPDNTPANNQKKRRSWSPTKRNNSTDDSNSAAGETATMRSGIRNSISSPMNQHLQRPRLHSDARNDSGTSGNNASNGNPPSRLETTSSIDTNVIPNMDMSDDKPIASGNGVSMAIHLAEPVLFLQGFENTESSPGNTAMLRGSLHLRVQKAAKVKAVTLKFKGKAITKWPEGIPPRKVEFDEQDTIMSHTWPFFNAQFESAEKGTNADHVQLFQGGDASAGASRTDPLGRSTPHSSQVNLSSKEAKKLALQVNQSRSFGKGDAMPGAPSVAAKGYRTFLPGDYIYNFELPLDSRLPETIDVELGSVKYELEAEVTRSGAFRANLVGTKEVTLIRAPAEGSLEQVEPIAISRNWEDQLHYDIVISGKSFPLGSQVPIAFKLTPLAKVQCHRIKVLVTENIEYFCSNKRVHRMEPTRKVQLFEKRADGPPVSTFPGSTMRVTAGGGIPYDARARAARGEDVTPSDTTNLLGNLEGDTNIGPTEMEFNVQLPSCHNMKERERSQRLHFDTTYQNIQVHHWIKIVMRLSKPDANDPTKRRHFEISIDSPFHILSCRATQANISLPAYSSPQQGSGNASLFDCGCPGAARRRNSHTSFVPTLNALNFARTGQGEHDQRPATPTSQTPGLARPQQAHVHGQATNHERPIHLLRAPSFNPPAFEDEAPPPPLITPPPQYDDIASPTHGLADYFSRLADAYDSDEGEDNPRSGRVNVPLTPGGRINRSMDIRRDWVPVGGR
ncbi:hypothetical protein LTR78_000656 [Recurvomyces mirabilis]|uniref:Arrestin C-terminal-like domain-containing protein n=1 Tax=Recurvomyces mirabilis TaxID=574656 RepID=A0AAE0WYA4_9PEZI|nr:hypothetical protein LTR78_000656 [Recurvomyces mirabilis]KAK5162310.1 hypothetical protein LTS14_000657 [Recurvomyces mirabilis]